MSQAVQHFIALSIVGVVALRAAWGLWCGLRKSGGINGGCGTCPQNTGLHPSPPLVQIQLPPRK